MDDSRLQQTVERKLKEESGSLRSARSFDRILISIVGFSWAAFQLLLPRVIILDSITVRAVHLAFAVLLVFFCFPFSKRLKKDIPVLHSQKKIPPIDFVFAAIACTVVLYIIIDRLGIAARSGRPNSTDVLFGVLVLVFVLEAARRSIGIPMVIVALTFTAYAFLGPYLPGIMAFRGVSLPRYLSQIVLSNEGIYGIPLDVSANTVFLFVLFGSLLDRMGAGLFFNELAMSLLGKAKGGPAKASVVSSGLTGLVSGSSIANVVTTGTFTIPLMKKVGYPGETAAATEVAASTNGQLMPPIMGAAAFIIAEYLGWSYFDVIRAAILPALVSYIALFYITHLEASKLGMMGLPKEEVPRFRSVMKDGFYHLIPLIILIFELAVMRHTPNLAVFNAIIWLVAVSLIRCTIEAIREKKGILAALRKEGRIVVDGMINGSKNMVPVALATAAAGIIVGVVNIGIGSMVVELVEAMAMGNIFLLLLITAIVSLIIGMGLPTTATYIVMASITVPIIVTIGGDMGLAIPAIAAHLFCFYFGILADDTPPVGLAAYAAAAIAESNPIKTGIKGFIYDLRTAVIPFMFILNSELLLQGVNGFFPIITVFFGAIIGALAFTSAVQGWFLVKNRWYEVPVFLAISGMYFLPGRSSALLGIDYSMRYSMYAIGLALYVGLYFLQKIRLVKEGRISVEDEESIG